VHTHKNYHYSNGRMTFRLEESIESLHANFVQTRALVIAVNYRSS